MLLGCVIPASTHPCWSVSEKTLGTLAIGASFGYIGFFLMLIALLMIPIATATFRVNEGEGYFRWMHVRLKEFAESGEWLPAGPG